MQIISKLPSQSNRVPTLLLRKVDDDQLAARFWNIGGRQQFMLLLGRFRSEFLLARSEKIAGLDWLLLMTSQLPDIESFTRRYGLVIIWVD